MISGEKQKILVGMSGGVDSAVSAYLLKQQGFNPIGVTLKIIGVDDTERFNQEVELAAKQCNKMSIPHHSISIKDEFRDTVIDYFIKEYLCGSTPNPCVYCNKVVKWKNLLKMADSMNVGRIATGHYANIVKNNNSGRYELYKGRDLEKDQTYMLWRLPQEYLQKTLLPLSSYKKREVMKIAKNNVLVEAEISESQDICFVPGKDYREFLRTEIPQQLDKYKNGEFVNCEGQVLGNHDGFFNFTVGQRKGFRLSFGERRYVKEIDSGNNRVVISTNEQLYANSMIINQINWVSSAVLPETKGTVKIRYNHSGVRCSMKMIDETSAKITFQEPQRAVSAGQSAVLYHQNKLILGGIIVKAIE